MGFIFLPIRSTRAGESRSRISCATRISCEPELSGFLCGILWELELLVANQMALHCADHGKPEDPEMPVPGYLGFPAFAWYFTM